MKCVGCDSTDGLDRVLLDRLTGAEIGALCESCLAAFPGPGLRDDGWRPETDCAVCAETANYELPRIECRIQYTDSRPDEVEYVLTDATLRLCTDHLRETLTESPTDTRTVAAVVSQ